MSDKCSICTDTLLFHMIIPCIHNNICGICISKIRLFNKKMICPYCNINWDNIIITSESLETIENKKFIDYDINRLTLDKNYNIYFETKSIALFFKKLRELFCPICEDYNHINMLHEAKEIISNPYNYKDKKRVIFYSNLKLLSSHLTSEHNLNFCKICVEHRSSFIFDHRFFTSEKLITHVSKGSEVTINYPPTPAHPKCEFCGLQFFGPDELGKHLNFEHFTCFICVKLGQGKYYKNYDTLEKHYKRDHFLCPDEDCLAKKFIVFDSELSLQAHNISNHLDMSKMSASDKRAASRLNIDINYAPYRQPNRVGGNSSSASQSSQPIGNNSVNSEINSNDTYHFPELSISSNPVSAVIRQPQSSRNAQPTTSNYSNRTSSGIRANVVLDEYPELSQKKATRNLPAAPAATFKPYTKPAEVVTPFISAARDALYLPLPEPVPGPLKLDRNKLLVNNITQGLNNDDSKYEEFKQMSSKYRNDAFTALEYYEEFMRLFSGSEDAESILMQLLALLPDEDKRSQLHAEYVKDKIQSTKMKTQKVPQTKQNEAYKELVQEKNRLAFLGIVTSTNKIKNLIFSIRNMLDDQVLLEDLLVKKSEAENLIPRISAIGEDYDQLNGKLKASNQANLYSNHENELVSLSNMFDELLKAIDLRIADVQKESKLAKVKTPPQVVSTINNQADFPFFEERKPIPKVVSNNFVDYKQVAATEKVIIAKQNSNLSNIISNRAEPIHDQSVFPTLESSSSNASPLVVANQFEFFNPDELPVPKLEKSRVAILIGFNHEAASTLLRKVGNAARNRTSSSRKLQMSFIVSTTELKNLGDFGMIIGKQGLRQPTLSFLASTMSRSESYYRNSSLQSILSQGFESMTSEELNTIYEFTDQLLSKFCDMSKYNRRNDVEEENLVVLKKGDDLDFLMGTGGKKGKNKK